MSRDAEALRLACHLEDDPDLLEEDFCRGTNHKFPKTSRGEVVSCYCNKATCCWDYVTIKEI